ncbi:hypothetical protein HY639_05255 [Candidatus Woesearchaeota archaeon]|nr:hypothetical protein [Candidatus Woesearchaeota archaeon]
MHVKHTKHDEYVLDLTKQISPFYDTVRTHIPIFNRKRRVIAEIDVLAKRGDAIDIYEVKCSHRPFKARQQLSRLRRIFRHHIKHSFFYCGSSGMLMVMDEETMVPV